MKRTHTEGPWLVYGQSVYCHIGGGVRREIARTTTYDSAVARFSVSAAEADRNAELISRAPQLEKARLEILEDIAGFLTRSKNDEAACDDLDALMERWRLILEISGPEDPA
ncbi:MAG: hypothetical protein JRE40_04040 [Deltaproteobacteria bacterium]|nr:hypothetical protein [Deltaproteobacteria bacterium]